VVGISDQGRVNPTVVEVAAGELPCASIPEIRGDRTTEALLLNVVSGVHLAVVAGWALICERARHPRVIRSWGWLSIVAREPTRNHITRRAVILGRARNWRPELISIRKSCTGVELLDSSLINAPIPSLTAGNRFRTQHWKCGPKGKLRRSGSVAVVDARVPSRALTQARGSSHFAASISSAGGSRWAIPGARVTARIHTTIVVHLAANFVTIRPTAASHSHAVAAGSALVRGLLVARHVRRLLSIIVAVWIVAVWENIRQRACC